jgi:hypothetical protein
MYLHVNAKYLNVEGFKFEFFSRYNGEEELPDCGIGYGSIEFKDGLFMIRMYHGAYFTFNSQEKTVTETSSFRREVVCLSAETFRKAVNTLYDFWELPHLISKPTYVSIVSDYVDVVTDVYEEITDECVLFVVAGSDNSTFDVTQYFTKLTS